MSARSIMVQGTASHAGKSTVVAALCRILSDAGYRVAPFKAQNMSLNSTVTPDGGEIAVSQAVQAEAARTPPTVEMNPVLLKPNGEGSSQVVLEGRPVGDMSIGEYYDRVDEWRDVVEVCYRALAERFDFVVAEGAGSPAEINIDGLANMSTAEMMDAPVLLVADIERGGAFASIQGTFELLGDRADRIEAFLINKFRGDRDILEPGVEELESRTGAECLGVLPYSDPGLPAEDSLSLRDRPGEGDVAVIRHSHVSNFTDVDPLTWAGVGVRYVEPDGDLGDPDAIVLPGTKRTLDDLRDLKESGLIEEVAALAGSVPIVGICGGYQMLGERVVDEVECPGSEEGAGLLPVETVFESYEKTTRWSTIEVEGGDGLLRGVESLRGYEVHMGQTTRGLLGRLGDTAHGGMTVGIYLHGAFHNPPFLENFAGLLGIDADVNRSDPFDASADLLRGNADTGLLAGLLGVDI